MIEETAVEVALKLLKKFWYAIPMLGLMIALAITSHHLSDARTALKAEGDFRHNVMVLIGAPKDDRQTLFTTISAHEQTKTNLADALEKISAQAKADHEHSVAADAALAAAQAENRKRFSAAEAEINRLEQEKSTGNCVADLLKIGVDTQAPWKGWK